jgi:hypothetical protein
MSLSQDTNKALTAHGADYSIQRWRRKKGHTDEMDKLEAAAIAIKLLRALAPS